MAEPKAATVDWGKYRLDKPTRIYAGEHLKEATEGRSIHLESCLWVPKGLTVSDKHYASYIKAGLIEEGDGGYIITEDPKIGKESKIYPHLTWVHHLFGPLQTLIRVDSEYRAIAEFSPQYFPKYSYVSIANNEDDWIDMDWIPVFPGDTKPAPNEIHKETKARFEYAAKNPKKVIKKKVAKKKAKKKEKV